MRFGAVHRMMTGLLGAMGVLAVVASGELNPWINILLILGLIASFLTPEEWHNDPWVLRITTVFQISFLLLQIARGYFFKQPLLELSIEFASALLVLRIITRRGAAHDQQLILLSLILLIAGTVLGAGLGYALCFLGFLIVAPGALVLSHLRREVEGNYRQGARDRTGLPVDVPRILRSRRVIGRMFLLFTSSLALPILLFTSLLFLLFPRVELSWMGLSRSQKSRVIGFDDRVDLGGVGELRANSTVALYAEIPGLSNPPPERIALHLRGTAFDTFDGKAWSRSNADWKPIEHSRSLILLERPNDPSKDLLFKFDLDPYDPPMLFLPQNAIALTARSRSDSIGPHPSFRIEQGSEGQLRYRSTIERGLHYEVWVSSTPPSPRTLSPEDRARYLSLPPLSLRIAQLAHQWADSLPSPLEQAQAIERHLRTEYTYDLASPSGAAPSPLDHFLFESKRGHCEYYSSAMSVMLRQMKIPSRNVTGYVGGQYNRFSQNYIIRQRDAHSWVEAHLDGIGWVTFDPTPPAFSAPTTEQGIWKLMRDALDASNQRWDRYIIRYDIYRQLTLLERFRSPSYAAGSKQGISGRHLLIALSMLLFAWGGWTLSRRWRSPIRPGTGRSRNNPARVVLQAVHLYEDLEQALATQRLGRPQGIPPLQHAQSAAVQAHPLGAEILRLTQHYQELRFGGIAINEEQAQEFREQVRKIRTYSPPQSSLSLPVPPWSTAAIYNSINRDNREPRPWLQQSSSHLQPLVRHPSHRPRCCCRYQYRDHLLFC